MELTIITDKQYEASKAALKNFEDGLLQMKETKCPDNIDPMVWKAMKDANAFVIDEMKKEISRWEARQKLRRPA